MKAGSLQSRVVPLVLLGLGGVGRALLRQIRSAGPMHLQRYGLRMQCVGVSDSSAALLSPRPDRPIPQADLASALSLKEARAKLITHPKAQGYEALAEYIGRLQGRAILVDCSAGSDTTAMLLGVLQANPEAAVVLANKKPLTQQQSKFDALQGRSWEQAPGEFPGCRSRWESTVGAGLPIIATINRLVSCGDEIETIRGSLSSTLGYLTAGLEAGSPFSRLVREVRDAGYTEPDPREDLRGADVARKALILARTMGWRLELPDIQLEPLYPTDLDSRPLDLFMERLGDLDGDFRERSKVASANQETLRYAVSLSREECRVGLVKVPKSDPLGQLTKTNQLVEIRSRLYPTPLVIQGRGAGVEATAAGVLSDIVELAVVVRPSRP